MDDGMRLPFKAMKDRYPPEPVVLVGILRLRGGGASLAATSLRMTFLRDGAME